MAFCCLLSPLCTLAPLVLSGLSSKTVAFTAKFSYFHMAFMHHRTVTCHSIYPST